jgi:hypothetical protein
MSGVKYSGKDLEITAGSTGVPCANVRSIAINERLGTIDTTGACDEFMTYVVARRDVDVTLQLLDSTDNTEVYNLFSTNDNQTLVVYPQGNSSGNPKLTCATFTITGRDRSIPYNDVVSITVTGKASGGFTETTV